MEDWRHTQAALFSYSRGEPAHSKNHMPTEEEWQRFAIYIHRGAVRKAGSTTGKGPLLVGAWLSMRAAKRGWSDLFVLWAEKAHKAGDPTRELLESSAFEELDRRLCLEERIIVGMARFQGDYEEVMGYPLKASPMNERNL